MSRASERTPAETRARRPTRRVVRRISPELFDAVVRPAIRRLDPVRLEAVRRVMVDGVRWADAAATPGVALSALSKAVARGWRAVDALESSPTDAALSVQARKDLPEGWLSVHLVVPAELLPELQQAVRRANALMQARRDRSGLSAPDADAPSTEDVR